jgi:hypothetical protein
VHADILSALRSSESRVFADEIIELTTVHAHAAIIVGPLRCTHHTHSFLTCACSINTCASTH